MRSRDLSRALEIRSSFDETSQAATLRLPRRLPLQSMPLVIAPHPFGWSVAADYYGGCQGLKSTEHRGWLNVASELGIAVLQPVGHQRAVEWCSMGYEGVTRDVPAWVDAVDDAVRLDRTRIYACGLSMGGLEALLMAGHHPALFAAAFVFNPVVDPKAWLEDLAQSNNDELRSEGIDRLIVEEVGGSPDEMPGAYAMRSAFSVHEQLRKVPLAIWWSHLDLVVPRQTEYHGKRLYDELKRHDANAPVTEYNHTARYHLPPTATDDQRWAIHETSDYRFAASWLLLHRRWSDARVRN